MFAAVVLPLVMEHEPKQAGQDIQIRIPSQEGANFASRVIQGAAPSPAKPSVPAEDDRAATGSAPVVPSPSEGDTANVPPPKAPAPVAAKPDELKPEPTKAESGSVHKPDTQTEKSERPAHADVSANKRDEAERAAAILSGQKTASADASSGFVVQLGAFKDAANVSSVRAKVKTAGYSSYTEALGDKTRVRAGPFASRDAAETAAAKLRKAGLSAVVAAR